jgi:hypothetical protein
MAHLERLIAMPDGPDRQRAMEAAMTEESELGRLTRQYLLIIAELQENTVTDVNDIDFAERTFEQVRDYYHQMYPLLREYYRVTDEFNSRDSINEPLVGALSTVEATQLALQRIGKPPRDRDDVLHAERYLRGLQEELRDQYPEDPPTLAEAITRVEVSVAGFVTRADEFESWPEEEQRQHIDFLVGELEGDHSDHLREVLMRGGLLEMLRQITADDERRSQS